MGKTSLLVQFDQGKFIPGSFSATVGIGFTVSCWFEWSLCLAEVGASCFYPVVVWTVNGTAGNLWPNRVTLLIVNALVQISDWQSIAASVWMCVGLRENRLLIAGKLSLPRSDV